ncbi:MAG: glycosyltransferase family 4 protein [Jiangellaceae bacterium]
MRVLRICSVFQPPATALRGRAARFDPIGGMQTHTHELSLALDALGVEQTIVTTRPPTAARDEALGAHGRIIRLGLPVRRFRQLYSWPAAVLLPRLASSGDLVHVHLGEDLAVVPLAMRAARRRRLPLVMTVHTSVRHTLGTSGAGAWLLKHVGGYFERHGSDAAAAVIVLTPRLAEAMDADGVRTPVHVLPSGVVPQAFDSTTPYGPISAIPGPRVLFLGRLHAQKQVDVLVRAAAYLPQAQVVLVGDGPHRMSLERLARQAGVVERVHFVGFVPHQDVPAVLLAADVLVMPSRYEELGTAMLEAMQAGVPIVASDTGGIPAVITHEHNGLLVPPGDPLALVDAVDRLLADRAFASALASAARVDVGRYDWTVLARRVLDIYGGVLSARAELAQRPSLA